eukprot:767693-Hanusia_phi.AAC.3
MMSTVMAEAMVETMMFLAMIEMIESFGLNVEARRHGKERRGRVGKTDGISPIYQSVEKSPFYFYNLERHKVVKKHVATFVQAKVCCCEERMGDE